MIGGQSNFLLALGWAVLNSLWQMAFLWSLYQIFAGIFRKASASRKSSFATAMIIAGFAWFIYTFFSVLEANTTGEALLTSSLIQAQGNEQLNAWLNTMLPVASIFYLILLVLPLFYFIRNYRYVQAIREFELSKVDVEWRIFIKNVAARMGIKKPVHIWLSGIVTSPVTIGFIKPVILLPLAAVNQLTTQQLEAVLLHELAHIRRYDYFINLLIRFIQSVLYFNPFVKSLVKIVEREREKSCDELVLQFQYDPYGYASALLTLEKSNYLPKPLAVAASGKKNDLLHRIEWMLGMRKTQTVSFNKIAGLFAGLLVIITLNGLLILTRPAKNEVSVSSISNLISPVYLFTQSNHEAFTPVTTPAPEMPAPVVVNHALPVPVHENMTPEARPKNELAVVPAVPQNTSYKAAITYVNYVEPIVIRELKDYQIEQVKEAVEASKKVLEEKQWKAMENKIGDAMTSCEKNLVKDQYEKELKKINWNLLENKLRVAYDNIDWNNINEKLNTALTEIRIDSLQQTYTSAITELTTLQQQLSENNLQGVPDTDISLKAIEQTRANVQKAINLLNKVRTRKIIHL